MVISHFPILFRLSRMVSLHFDRNLSWNELYITRCLFKASPWQNYKSTKMQWSRASFMPVWEFLRGLSAEFLPHNVPSYKYVQLVRQSVPGPAEMSAKLFQLVWAQVPAERSALWQQRRLKLAGFYEGRRLLREGVKGGVCVSMWECEQIPLSLFKSRDLSNMPTMI